MRGSSTRSVVTALAWVALPLLGATGACSSKAKTTGDGGDCAVATDCDDGLVCVPQPSGKRVCSRDLTPVQSPVAAADAGAAPPAGNDGGAPPSGKDGGPPDAASPPLDAAPPPDAAPPADASPPADAAVD